MTKAILAVIAVGLLTAACAVRTERTVVERPVPVPAPATAVVVTDPGAPAPSTVYVPAR